MKLVNPSPCSVSKVSYAMVVLVRTLCFKTKNKLDQVCPMYMYKMYFLNRDMF